MAQRAASLTKNRPAAVLVIAILHFVFGTFGLLGSVCGGGMFFFMRYMPTPPTAPGQPKVPNYMDIMTAMSEKAPGFTAVQYGGMAMGLVLAVLMIVSGLDLVRMRARGRTLSIAYASLSILTTLLTFIYNLVFTMPVMSEVMDQMFQPGAMGPMNPQQQQAFQGLMRFVFQFSYYAGLLAPFFQMIYPVVVLIIMYRPHVRAAFREGPPLTPVEVAPDETDQFEARER